MKFAAEPDPDLSPLFPKIVAVKIDRSTVPAPGDPLFTGEPDLVETQPGFVVRQDLSIQPDGSFSLPPD